MLIAIDTGGTKTLITAFNREGEPGVQYRMPTPHDATEYLHTVRNIIHQNYIAKHRPVDVIVIGIRGLIRDNQLQWDTIFQWKNLDLATALNDLLDIDVPIWIENDANLAGLSETIRLPEQPRNSLYVTISTGIGTGITADGKIDPNMALSEGGQMLIEYDGKLRTWESFASGKSIYETYDMLAQDITSPAVWKHIADKLSRGFLVMIPMIMPDIIIIGGSIGVYFDRYINPLKHYLRTQLPEHIPMPKFEQAKYPEEAVIYGCYYYGIQRLSESTTE
ncbi:ROK family protein [Candidatus Saccharibacteria bacterium]|nr:ROK family protein [Candidatus Saccharibacteria bacterium]NCU40600.1 ROK family protein [Candidatus Saccharibacteria bacterium]